MNPADLKRLLKAALKAHAPKKAPSKPRVGKGPWITVMGDHTDVVPAGTDDDLEARGPYIDSTIVGRPDRTIDSGSWLVGLIGTVPEERSYDDRIYILGGLLEAPDGREGPMEPPYQGPKAKSRSARPWSGR